MDKRGISPLIATVLIIGFTIALAVVIMTWGFDFFESMIKEQNIAAESKLRCVNLDFKIEKVSCGTAGMDITIDNLKSQDAIEYFNIRARKSDDIVVLSTKNLGISGVEAAGLVNFKSLQGSLVTGDVVDSIDVIPVLLSEDGSEIICTEGIKSKMNLGCTIA